METLYRKVAVSERLPEEDNWYHTNCGGYDFNPNTKEFEDVNGNTVQIQYWLEEIPDPTAQLQADKAELLEALEKISKVTDEGYITADTNFQIWESELKQVHNEVESVIEKHKQ